MSENVSRFFERYASDSALRSRIEEAVACYPGSLEVRESLVKAVLLPVAEELGLPFTVEEWEDAIRRRVPPRTVDANLEAFARGRQAVRA